METMANRIEQALMRKNGGNQSEMARFVGVSPQAVQKWISGEAEPRGKNLVKAAEFLGIPAPVLKFGGTDISNFVERRSNVIALHPEDSLPDGYISIKQSNVCFSAGNGHEARYDIIEESEPATYQLSWFQKERINPNNARRFKVTGDSQEPMLYDGDTVLVNLSERDVVDGKLYAIRYGNELRLKNLTRLIDGTLILRSRNPIYKDEEVPASLAEEHITIIGRVRDKSGKGGL